MRLARSIVLVVSVALGTARGDPVAAEPFQRPPPHAGLIVSAKGGEELQPVGQAVWRPAEARQDLLGGDALRTNAIGNLAILFADQTQIRVGRNSVLLVKDIAGPGPARFGLPIGTVWARAARGGRKLTIETPSAAAAIRGTDWSLAVGADGTTTLIVLEGTVELRNALGAVNVGQGEAAMAAIGRRPTKIMLVRPRDREQMLFYLSLRDAFSWLPSSPLDPRRQRAERARLKAIPAAARTAEDWLDLAEVALGLDGRGAAAQALAEARKRGLDPARSARADLVEGMMAGSQQQWAAARLRFERALPHLTGRRRVSALYGRYFAAALAEPSRAPALPSLSDQDDPYAALAHAWLAGFLQDPEAALAILRAAERRHPDAVILPAARAQIAQLVDGRAEMLEAARRAQFLDPDDPFTIEAVAQYKVRAQGDLDGALADLRRGVAVAPGNSDLWNALAQVQNERNAGREAEQAFLTGIAADPEDPAIRVNYAILLLDQSRVHEAKRQIDAAFALDPAFHAGYAALGRYYLQTGAPEQAIEALLAGSAANPAHSNTLLGLAVAYYQSGDDPAAFQQLDNAERLDPSDPIVPLARAAFALDRYEADTAIASAREAVRRFRARGGYYSPLAESRQSGSYLAQSFRFLGLEEWGRFYGDAVFDPFSPSGYFDQAIATRADPFIDRTPVGASPLEPEASPLGFPALIQGLLFEPLAIASPLRRTQIMREPFADGEVGGGPIVRNGKVGWTAEAAAQFFSNDPFPIAAAASGSGLSSNGDRLNDRVRDQSGSVLVGANPRPYDHLLFFATASHDAPLLPGPVFLPTPQDDRSTTTFAGGIGWGHEFGERNALTALGAVAHGRDRSFRSLLDGLLTRRQIARQTTGILALGHLYGIGRLTLHYGLEGSRTGTDNVQEVRIIFPPTLRARNNPALTAARPYADAAVKITERIGIEAGAYGAILHGAGYDINRFEPRFALSYAPAERHWLRAGYREETAFPSPLTLSPVTTLGLVPDQTPIATGGRTKSLIARWDAEWDGHVFTAIEYQHQVLRGIGVPIPQTIDTFSIGRGRLDRVSGTANVWIGWGFGLFGQAVFTDSEDRSAGANRGGELPLIPRRVIQIGGSWAHPSRIKVNLTQSFVGRRTGDLAGTRLDPYASTDLSMNWEPLDRRLAIDLALLNLLDKSYRLATGIPAPGRTFVGNIRIRF